MIPWNQLLREARRSRHLTYDALSARSGVPVATLKSYELGLRTASRPRLIELLDALDPDQSARNATLLAAGYAPDGRGAVGRFMSLEEAGAAVDSRPWPALVMSETIEMHAANDLMVSLWGFDRSRLQDPIRRSALSMIAEPPLAERCLNWDEAVSGIIAVFKAHRGRRESLEAPSSYFAAILDEISRGKPSLVTRFTDLWDQTQPAPRDKVSWTYRIGWRAPGVGTMRFHCVVHSVNEVDSLDIDDWIPADAASHRNIERLRSRGSGTKS